MKIALLEVDSKWPNFALMKISAWHKSQGDTVEWYNPFDSFDICYMSKIFSFTPDYGQYMTNVCKVVRGGTGYSIESRLPEAVERQRPDYSVYRTIPSNLAYGFLTRGCPNKCKWCVVPQKEGAIVPYADIEEIVTEERNEAILMDNNILASDYGLGQLEKIVRMNETRKRKIRIDLNQGLDARLVTDDIAKLLARLKWISRIRFGCDTPKQVTECERACEMIDKYGYRGEYFFYCILLDDFRESFDRVNHWKGKGRRFLPHCQPFRDPHKKISVIPQWQKDLAYWADKKWIFSTCEFKDFEPRKGFRCSEYFK